MQRQELGKDSWLFIKTGKKKDRGKKVIYFPHELMLSIILNRHTEFYLTEAPSASSTKKYGSRSPYSLSHCCCSLSVYSSVWQIRSKVGQKIDGYRTSASSALCMTFPALARSRGLRADIQSNIHLWDHV